MVLSDRESSYAPIPRFSERSSSCHFWNNSLLNATFETISFNDVDNFSHNSYKFCCYRRFKAAFLVVFKTLNWQSTVLPQWQWVNCRNGDGYNQQGIQHADQGAGIALWLERRTRGRKLPDSSPRWSGRIFFSFFFFPLPSSPGWILCDDCCFGIRSTPVLPQ